MKQPFNISVLQAKNELMQNVRAIGVKYDLPGVVLDLILSEVLADERQAHMALLSEQYAQAKEAQSGNTRPEHKVDDGPCVGGV